MTSVDMKEAAAAYEAGSQYFLNLARAVTPELMDVHAERMNGLRVNVFITWQILRRSPMRAFAA